MDSLHPNIGRLACHIKDAAGNIQIGVGKS
jgi:hypothetical protein